MKESGVLLAEVVTLDERDGVTFAGLDAGFNVAPEPFIYGALVPIVLARAADAEPSRTYTVAGNINEGDDLWGEEVPLPELAEGDILALLLVGAYGQFDAPRPLPASAGRHGRVRRAGLSAVRPCGRGAGRGGRGPSGTSTAAA